MPTTYVAAAGANKVISTGAARLIRIIIGVDIGSSVIEISDSPSDGDADIKFKISGSNLEGSIEIGAEFRTGITADIVNQTDVTFVWEPISS